MVSSPESSPQFKPLVDKENAFEFTSEAIDELSLRTSESIRQIDAFIDGNQESLGSESPIIRRYREALNFLTDKTPEELQGVIDPENKFDPREFSVFKISTEPPGAIHLELGTSEDLARLRNILSEGQGGSLSKILATGDEREIELFAAQYYPPKVFGGGNYLGVIVTVRENIQDPKTIKGIMRHEYSHALMQEVIRPLSHRKVVNIGLGDRFAGIRKTLQDMGAEKTGQLAEALGVTPSADTPDHMRSLVIGTDIYNEQYLLDELRAYTFNMGFLPPKRQITDKELEGEDSPQSAKVETVRKYFEVNLLHTKAGIISRNACSRSLAILGSCLSLSQAERLLEKDSLHWKFDENENDQDFENRISALSKILIESEYETYRDFQHRQGGELISQEHMWRVILPSKEMVDAEIARRYGNISNTSEEFQKKYLALYATSRTNSPS